VELPTVWAASSAERFAMGAVALLEASGVVEYLSFGSESGTWKR
jgi:predicted nucleotidyltransferase